MRDETRRAAESLAASVLVGALHLLWLSGRFATEQGRGGLVLLVGTAFTTGVLWVMIAMRSLSSGNPFAPELDDGLTSMAVTGWVVALVPPRAENFLLENAVDDFAWVYLPVALLAVFATLGARLRWPARTVPLVLVRLVAATVPCLLALAGLVVFVAQGPGASAVAARALGLAGVAAVATVVLSRRAAAG